MIAQMSVQITLALCTIYTFASQSDLFFLSIHIKKTQSKAPRNFNRITIKNTREKVIWRFAMKGAITN